MEKKTSYQCGKCKKAVYGDGETAPECCGKPMALGDESDACLQSSTAEHARADSGDDPCDDGRAG